MVSFSNSLVYRPGVTATEVLIATVLLSTAVVGTMKMLVHSSAGMRNMEQSRALLRELENARATIGSWPSQQVTQENIEKLPFSSNVDFLKNDIRWKAEVATIDQPLPALQVTLSIQAVWKQQSTTPARLTFWRLAADDATAKESSDGS